MHRTSTTLALHCSGVCAGSAIFRCEMHTPLLANASMSCTGLPVELKEFRSTAPVFLNYCSLLNSRSSAQLQGIVQTVPSEFSGNVW